MQWAVQAVLRLYNVAVLDGYVGLCCWLYCWLCCWAVLDGYVKGLCVLGSVILPPSCVPKQNLMFLYVVLLYVSLCFRPVSTWLPDLSPCHPFHSCHLCSPCT